MPTAAWTLSDLPDNFLENVQSRMLEYGGVATSVRFGTLGKGFRPNYQIESPLGSFAFVGNGHALASKSKQYIKAHLTRRYLYQEIANRFANPSMTVVAVPDLISVLNDMRASATLDALAMLDVHASYPGGHATLEELAHGIDATREDALEAAYRGFAENVALSLGLSPNTGMHSLAILKQTTRQWALKPEVKEALEETLLDDTETKATTETERRELRTARIGQGDYRARMLTLWGGRCSVTGCAVKSVLIASHAKAWAESSNEERLDAYNGLLLSGTFDRLFDVGLIGFADDGQLLISDQLTKADISAMGITDDTRLRLVFDENKKYLKAHRDKYGLVNES
jgi:hypothetical protein